MKTSKLADNLTLADMLAIKQLASKHKSLLDTQIANDAMLDKVSVETAIKLGKNAIKLA